MNGVNGSFWEEGLLNNYPIAIEPEVMYENYEYLSYDIMSWGYWTISGPVGLNPIVPKVSTYKAMTKGKEIFESKVQNCKNHITCTLKSP